MGKDKKKDKSLNESKIEDKSLNESKIGEENGEEMSYEDRLKHVSIIAKPMANKKLAKNVLKNVFNLERWVFCVRHRAVTCFKICPHNFYFF